MKANTQHKADGNAGITVIGLGPGDERMLTREAWDALCCAEEVYLRTHHHPTVEHLPAHLRIQTFDAVYEQHDTFDQVYDAIAHEIIRLGERPAGVVYCVPGHPLVGESTVQRILEWAPASGLTVHLVSGLSFVEPALEALGIDALDGLQIADGTRLAQCHHPWINPDLPALIAQVYSRVVASGVKLALMNLYHDDHPVVIIKAAGGPSHSHRDIRLYELDWQDDLDHLTTVFVPPVAKSSSVAAFQEVIARLRAPGGCPWDREQTHQTLESNLLEETYEVLAALDADDPTKLCEELGDLLLQIVLHAQIATEEETFKAVDVLQGIIAKMERRHPHVFGDAQANDSQEVLRNWEQIKRDERDDPARSLFDGIPKGLPALAQALELQRRAARVGFDWDAPEPVLAKVAEEAGEIQRAEDADARLDEFGDLLFSLVNAARWMEIDPETALRHANQRFAARFQHIEQGAAAAGRLLEDMTLAEMDALWEQAKAGEASDVSHTLNRHKEVSDHA